jgi:hypothetical protein
MENSKKNFSNNSTNNNLEIYIKKSSDMARQASIEYIKMQGIINNTPLNIKIANFIVPFTITYIFTIIYYNLPLSIIFSLITFFVLSLLSKLMAVIYLILYIIIVISVTRQTKSTLGTPILQTDIIKMKIPYNCLNTSLSIESNKLEKDLYGGYFTYSFWLYVKKGTGLVHGKENLQRNSQEKGKENSNDQTADWNNYRYNEWKSIFYRGNAIDGTGDLSSLVQFPGIWLTPVVNNMVIVFQTGSYVERLEINNIPFNTWTNFNIVVESKSVSVYINGVLDRTLNLHQSITVMNAYNLYLTSDMLLSKNKNESGFAGFLGELIYYNYALTSADINKSYFFYKKIIDIYQNKIDIQNNYIVPGLITNSDYYVNIKK